MTLPLALPGVFAGSLLTFIPAMGDYINAELLGNPETRMIGNVIQNRLLVQNDYPVGVGAVVHPDGRASWSPWRSTPGCSAPNS